jgi:hypothetical protein
MLGMVTSHKKGKRMHDDETMVGACSRKVHTWSVTFQRHNGGGGGGGGLVAERSTRFDSTKKSEGNGTTCAERDSLRSKENMDKISKSLCCHALLLYQMNDFRLWLK